MDFVGDILGGSTQPPAPGVGINFIFKLLFFVVIVFYILYAFLLALRVRILADTVDTKFNYIAKAVTYIHLIVVLIGSFLALIVLLLA
jgi:hypothetical protein